jgi:DNA replication protein DnaC
VTDADWTDGTDGEQAPIPKQPQRDYSKITEATPEFRARIERMLADLPAYDGEERDVENSDSARDAVRREIDHRTWVDSLRAAEKMDLAEWRLEKLAADQHARELGIIARTLRRPRYRNVVLTGSTGPGKTSAAIALGWAAVDAGLTVRFLDHAKYLLWLQPDKMPAPPNPYAGITAAQLRARALSCDLLVLDDLGAGQDQQAPASEHVTKETLQLVGDRADTPGKITVTTTNLRSEALTLMFGDRFMSRLSKEGKALKFTGPDRRGKRLTF